MNSRTTKILDSRGRQESCELMTALRVSRTGFCDMRGFTLIELILVSAMIGILAVIALPTYSYMVTKAKVSRAEADLRTLEKDVTAYLIDKGTLPSSLNAIGRGDLRDPWNRPYQYVNFALGGSPYQDFLASSLNTDFDLYSMGKDGISTQSLADASCADDIIRAGDGGFIGLGNEF